MPLAPGYKLASYEILSAIGSGGMGDVYRARDARLGRDVALKVLPPDVVNEPGRLERFDREARAIAALNHPHIVTIYSTEQADGIRFLTMELVEGHTLSDLVVPSGIGIGQFLEIAIPLADALAAAHQKQITHRDLKPGNVMISNDGRVKVLDFGLARVGGSNAGEQTLIATQAPITHHGMIVGTMPYMSPEQVEGQPLDERTDLFSLGVIFHELLSGQRPFKGSSSAALMSSILRDTPSGVAQLRADVPDSLDRLVDRLLAKRREDRWQTARDLHHELKNIQRAFDSGSTAARRGSNEGSSSSRERSIAVMAFSDLSEKKDQDWFCDGIAEEILNALAPLPGLRVAARTSSFSFRGKTDDLRVIGEKLNVDTVLEGSVRRAGDRVRITAQLSDAREGRQLWSERFDRELKDIFDVQDEIARAIVERLRVTLTVGERLVQKRTTNMEAYELLLRGRTLVTKRGPAIGQSIEFFEKAVALDPQLADAHAGLADAYRLMGIYGLAPLSEVVPKATASVARALALDPDHLDALAIVANMKQAFEWKFAEARELTNRVLAIEPTHVRALAEGSITLATAAAEHPGPELVALIHSRIARARSIDPLNAWVMSVESLVLFFTGHVNEAIDAADRACAADRENFTANWSRVIALAAAGREDEALNAADEAFAIFKRHPSILAEVAAVYARRGNVLTAEAIFHELSERAKTSYVSRAARAAVAASAGLMDDARQLLGEAIAERDAFLTFYKLPACRSLRADRECTAMLNEMVYIKDAIH